MSIAAKLALNGLPEPGRRAGEPRRRVGLRLVTETSNIALMPSGKLGGHRMYLEGVFALQVAGLGD